MKIFVVQHEWIQFIEDYLDFNDIVYHTATQQTKGAITTIPLLDNRESDQLLILSFDDFTDLINCHDNINKVIYWTHEGNRILVTRDGDAFRCFNLMDVTSMQELDQKISKHSITMMLYCQLSDRYWLNNLKNFRKVYFPNLTTPMALGFDKCGQTPRIRGASIKKADNSQDFMMTMVKKKTRPHRNILWQQIRSRPALLQRGNVIYRRLNEPWLGHYPGLEVWPDSLPSMDLYNNSWLEIVPETCYKDVYFITEKTIKPIGTQTPFLTLSNARFLEYLRNLGFQTFHGIIDEKYDTVYCVQDRARMLVDELENICKNGARSFYESCHDRLVHNFNRLAEMQGSWRFHMDSFIQETLESVVDQKRQ